MEAVDYFDIFKGANSQYYWNLHNGGNHAIVATGGEGFTTFGHAIRAVENFREEVEHAYLPQAEAPSMAPADIIDDVDEDTVDMTNAPIDQDSDFAELDDKEVTDTH